MVSEQVESNPAAPPVAMPESNGPVPTETVVATDRAPEAGHAPETDAANRRRAAGVWLAAIVAFLLFVGFASVSREAGRLGGRVRLTRAWSLLADNLPHGTAVQVLFWGAIALFLAAASGALWLALTSGTTTADALPARSSDPE